MHRKGIFLFVLIFLLILALTTILINSTQSFAQMASYQKTDFTNGYVNCNVLNMRLGPGLNFPIVHKVHSGETIRVFAKINGWYLIQNEENCTGMVRSDYISPGNAKTTVVNQKGSNLQSAEKEIFDLVNAKRKSIGLRTLKIDSTLENAARVKAKEMVTKKYFSHSSPTYGSPFNMMKKYGVKYREAGENIAGSSTTKDAFDAWMKSQSHKDNILNKNYNFTGIGVYASETYGKIIVQEFVGR